MRIAVIGEVSAGKSSFINSILLAPVATVSLQRETFVPTTYFLKNNTTSFLQSKNEGYTEQLKKNELIRDKKSNMPELKINFQVVDYLPANVVSLTDYPGINDANDTRDIIGLLIANIKNYDMIIFVTAAESALVSPHFCNAKMNEVDLSKKIKSAVENSCTHGSFCKFIYLVTKYDVDEDLEKIYKRNVVSTGIESFRWNSFNRIKAIATNAFKNIGNEWNKINRIGRAEDISDHDSFISFIEKFDLLSAKRNCLYKYHKANITFNNLKKLYDYYCSKNFIREKESEFKAKIINLITTTHPVPTSLRFDDESFKHNPTLEKYFVLFEDVLIYEKAGWVHHTELMRYLAVAKGWCYPNDIPGIKDFIAKFTKKEAEWFVRPARCNDIDFYKENLQYPLIDRLFTLFMRAEFAELQKKDISLQKDFLKEYGPFAKDRLKPEIYDWCKKNKIHLIQNAEIELMKLCPEFFEYQLNSKLSVNDMIKLINKEKYSIYENYNLIINQKYEEHDEIKVLNVLCEKMKPSFEDIKKYFANTCYKLDLSNFEEFYIFIPLLQIKCWIFIHFDATPVYSALNIKNDYKVINTFIKKDNTDFSVKKNFNLKKVILYSKEFLEYCYIHLNETIPQELLLKFCGF